MLDAQLNALVTVAGTGGVGFAGDGGLGRLALLRHPEGLALKPNMASGQEVRPSFDSRQMGVVCLQSRCSTSGFVGDFFDDCDIHVGEFLKYYYDFILLLYMLLYIRSEKWWLEDCFPFGMVYFQGRAVKLPGGTVSL